MKKYELTEVATHVDALLHRKLLKKFYSQIHYPIWSQLNRVLYKPENAPVNEDSISKVLDEEI